MKYLVVITPLALAEVQEAFDWLAQRSSTAAQRWRLELLRAINSLESFPTRCAVSRESSYLRREVRELLHGKRQGVYRVLFEIRGDTVYVLRVRHAAKQSLGESEN